MKELYESLLDDDDELFKRTRIPKKPKISKEDFFTYEQAWYDILASMDNQGINSKDDLKSYLDLYVKWHSKFKFIMPENIYIGNNDLSDDFNYMSAKQIKYKYLNCIIQMNDHEFKWFKRDIEQEKRTNISYAYQVVNIIWNINNINYDYCYLIDLFNENKCFQKDPHYKEYYDLIKNELDFKYNIYIK